MRPCVLDLVCLGMDLKCVAEMTAAPRVLRVRLFDKDLTGTDDSLGRATIDISSVSTKGQIDQWIHLQQAKHGQVHIRLMWLYLTSESGDLPAALMETQQLRVTSMSSALLLVFIDSCKNLPNARAQSNPDPFIQLSLGKRQEISQVVMRNCDPVYEQGYTFLVNNPENDSLSIIVKDQKTGLELGQLLYHLASVLNKPGCTINHQPFTLNRSGPDSKIFMSLSLKILKLSEQEDENNETKEESTNDDVKSEEDMSEREQLLRQQSLRSQDSPAKSKTSSESSPLHRPPSRESMSSSTNTNTEELIKPITAPGALASSPPSSNGTSIGLGKIQITIRYSQHRQRLIVLVHKIENLPLNDPSNIPDPYVKLYLLPDRAKDSKRKTEVIKDNCNPVFDEAFEYLISKGEMNSKQLEVTVLTRKSWISGGSPVMGQVVVDLNQFDITKATTTWYELQPEIPRDS